MSTRHPFDGPWKEVLDQYTAPFLAFFLPDLHAAIDWERGIEILDKEFQQLLPPEDDDEGERRVDKQIKAWRGDDPFFILIHVEVQSQYRLAYERTIAHYHILIRAAYRDIPVFTVVVYGDDHPDWRPNHFEDAIGACRLRLDFATMKLLDYQPELATLEQSNNPLAVVVAAHLYALQTRDNPAQRLAYKRCLFASLYQRNFDRDTLRQAFRLMDWLLRLPLPERSAFVQYVRQHEKERAMTYITSYEEYVREEFIEKGRAEGREEGREEGQAQVILRLLERKFGPLPTDLTSQIQALHSAQFMALVERLLDFTALADLTVWLAAHQPAPSDTSEVIGDE